MEPEKDSSYGMVRGVAWCWILGGLLFLLIAWALSGLSPGMVAKYPYIGVVAGIIGFVGITAIATAYFNFKQARWSYIVGIFLSIFALILFPIGTVVGVLGLVGYTGQLRAIRQAENAA